MDDKLWSTDLSYLTICLQLVSQKYFIFAFKMLINNSNK